MINLNLLKEQKEQETFRAGRGWKLTLCSRSCTFSSNRYKHIEKNQSSETDATGSPCQKLISIKHIQDNGPHQQ